MTGLPPDHNVSTNSAEALVEHLGLLMQMPVKLRQEAKAPLTCIPGSGQTTRTCIDRGTGLMVTLRAGYADGVGIASASNSLEAENTRHWNRWSLSQPHKTGEGLIFGMPSTSDMNRALDFVGGPTRNSKALSELLTRGTIYMATRAEPETQSSWISVGLGRRQSPRAVLAAIKQPNIWGSVSAALASLIGRPITDGSRPWSVALPVSGEAAERGIVRVGSTLWGRLPESSEKSTRLAQQATTFGTDQHRAESLYGLVAGQNAQAARVGVAAEYDFENEALIGAQFTLRVPDSSPGYTRQPSEIAHG